MSTMEVGLITGLESSLSGVTLYPNPVAGDRVYLSLPSDNDMLLEVFDVMGARLIVLRGDSEGLESFNVSSLRNGQYMLRVTSGSEVITQKFLVLR